MKLTILALAFSLVAFGAQAEDQCSPDAEVVIASISAKPSCYEASKLAQECAWGSNVDIQIAGAAGAVCEKEMGKLKASDSSLLKTMKARCASAHARVPGSLARSANAFCVLSAIEFMNGIAHASESN